MLRTALSFLTFLVRHLVTLGLVLLFGATLWTLIYFGLLALAIVTGSSIGGPLAYPAGLVGMAFLLAVGGALFIPACAAGRLFTWLMGWPRITGIPVVFLTSCGLYFLLAHVKSGDTPSHWLATLSNFTLWLSIPLGVYWWATEGPGALVDLIPRILRRCTQKETGER